MDGSASSDLHTENPSDTGSWPDISDYWPDAPHRTGPAADGYPDGPAPPETAYAPEPQATRVTSPPPRPRRRGLRVFLSALAVVVFLGGSFMVLARLVARDDNSGGAVTAEPAQSREQQQQDDAGVPAGNAPVSVQPEPSAGGTTAPSAAATPTALPFTSGTFELTGNVVELDVTVAALGNEPVQFSTPDGSGLEPRLSRDGRTVKLDPDPDGSKGSGRLDVTLNSRVTWSITMTGGVTRGTFTLTGGKLRRIDLEGGAARWTMALPTPAETLPIRMTGGVNTWQITTADQVPVTVLLRHGGRKVVLNGKTTEGHDRGTRLKATGGDNDSGGLDIDAVAGLGTLTVAPAD